MKKSILLLALILAFAVVPCHAKSKVYGGTVYQYEFTDDSPVDEGPTLEFCWELVPGQIGGVEADKYSLEIYGIMEIVPLEGESFSAEASFSFGTTTDCYTLELDEFYERMVQWVWDNYGLLPADLDTLYIETSAKVKGLDPNKSPQKRQDNVWSVPLEDFTSFSARFNIDGQDLQTPIFQNGIGPIL